MKLSQQTRIEKAFSHHPPKGDQVLRYVEIRSTLKQFALRLCDMCPDSRELNSALKHLEEAQHWAIASICRNE